METKENTPMPSNPKPTEEVQLNIETVTPETEKDVVSTEDSKDNTPKQEKESAAKPDKDNDTSASAEEHPAVDELSKGESPSDEIETVSP